MPASPDVLLPSGSHSYSKDDDTKYQFRLGKATRFPWRTNKLHMPPEEGVSRLLPSALATPPVDPCPGLLQLTGRALWSVLGFSGISWTPLTKVCGAASRVGPLRAEIRYFL